MDMFLIAGLGNPGKEYAGTRHNIGFEVIDLLAEKIGAESGKKKFGSLISEAEFEGKKLILLKPQEYMNCSGQAIATVKGFYKIYEPNIMVAVDDMAIEPSMIRIRAKGSAGGHNGLADIIEKLGTDEFARIRIGIGQAPHQNWRNYVLGKFTPQESEIMAQVKIKTCEAIFCWLRDGIESAMNRFNVKNNGKSKED